MAKKKKVYIEPKKDLTMALFTSLMLILLTFFIVLSSMGVMDNKRKRLAMNSLMGSMGILPGGTSARMQQPAGHDISPATAPISSGAMDIKKVRATLRENGNMNGTGVSEGALGVVITMKNDVLFEPDSADFLPDGRRNLALLSALLKDVENPLIVTGHTSSIPIEGEPYYSNWGLSSARALVVMSYLRENGVQDGRLSAYGLGSQRPIASNDTYHGRQLNNRVEITVVGDLPGDMAAEPDRIDEPMRTFQYRGFKFRLEEM